MQYMVPVLIVLALIPTAYYFFLIRRIIRTAGQDPNKPVFIAIELALCAVAWHFLCQVTSTGAIILLLFLIADIVVLLVDLIIRKITGQPSFLSGWLKENTGSAAAIAATGKTGTARKIWRIIAGFCIVPLAFALYSLLYGGYNIRNTVETHYTVTQIKIYPVKISGYVFCRTFTAAWR